MQRQFLFIILFFMAIFVLPATASQKKIDKILAMESAPFGVVFEVVERDKSDLEWAFPKIKQFSEQLRKRFPDIGIAVVSHGKEQFGLLKTETKDHEKVHKIVQSLVKDNDIPVHVCGTHASWYDKKPEDFPDYVDVSPAGPTEIENYKDMGYVLVVLEE